MSYVALYRKWRPQTFDDVVGQGHIVTTLKNAVINNRLSHAYLFCGTRGTGKTSLAHILSRAVNCTCLQAGNPCNKCEICQGIISGSILDVIEIDAASNNSVDNIRQLREDVVYSPITAKYKVYIIDEVHMLSGGAFNALLKTLEEPPEYVMFILATTEPHKLPATILSRCQRFDFKRIPNDEITGRLKIITDSNGINSDDDALSLISKLSGGALRDAISILDQCIAAHPDHLTREGIIDAIGLSADSFLCDTSAILISRDVKSIYGHVHELLSEGKDVKQYIQELIGYFRNLMIIKFGADRSYFPEIPDDTFVRMSKQSDQSEVEWLITVVKELSSFENVFKNASNPGIMLEVLLAKLCLGQFQSDGTIEALNARIASLEKRLEIALTQAQAPHPTQMQAPYPTQVPAPEPTQAPTPLAPEASKALPHLTKAQTPHPTQTKAPYPAQAPTPLHHTQSSAQIVEAQPQAQLASQVPQALAAPQVSQAPLASQISQSSLAPETSQEETQHEPQENNQAQNTPATRASRAPQELSEAPQGMPGAPHQLSEASQGMTGSPQQLSGTPEGMTGSPEEALSNELLPSSQIASVNTPRFIDKHSWAAMLNTLKQSGSADLYSMLFHTEAFTLNGKFYISLLSESKPFQGLLGLDFNYKKIKKFINDEIDNTFDLKIITEDAKQNLLAAKTETWPIPSPTSAAAVTAAATAVVAATAVAATAVAPTPGYLPTQTHVPVPIIESTPESMQTPTPESVQTPVPESIPAPTSEPIPESVRAPAPEPIPAPAPARQLSKNIYSSIGTPEQSAISGAKSLSASNNHLDALVQFLNDELNIPSRIL